MKKQNPKKTAIPSDLERTASRAYVSSLSLNPADSKLRQGGTSERLSDKQVHEVIAEADYALAELPLNRFVTIDWERAGVDDAAAATRTFLKLATDFCRSHDRAFAYIWVIEPCLTVGIHVHILMHLDHDLAKRFSQLQGGWVKKAGGRSAKGIRKTKHVGKHRTAYLRRAQDSGAFAAHHRFVSNYILKYCSFETARELNFTERARSGLVVGQRTGCSRNLAPQARLATR
ncbi:rolling circle replication-associated protein [Sphingomonas prati]|uniref:Inovirus Gp2 family protein n=1 Tax=Sphingomonas prati TaxID=1843237 RepID=A0A7W9BQX8_9SPHN|nr:hypothetical protein [Sphingomonas prati]MBB5728321.1 hypothetical protein [Sphingomonas prati]GGE74702.1 hypothetical protein GCM10011404_04050 [Sphingomonas prati]